MSEIKNGAIEQYGAEPFEQQQFGTAGVEGVKASHIFPISCTEFQATCSMCLPRAVSTSSVDDYAKM